MKPMELSKSNFTTGYLIISAIAVMAYTLALDDLKMLVFAIPLVLVFALGASKDKGSVDSDLEQVGWTSKNTEIAIPFGIIGGFASLILGGLVMQFTPENTASIIPDMSAAMARMMPGSVIPLGLAVGFNIISQWAIVAPSEESLSKVLGAQAGMSFFKNIALAYSFGILIWIIMHIPTFIISGTSASMYLVLIILGVVTAGLYFITRNLISAIVAHSTFNTGVLITANGMNIAGFYIVGVLIIVLAIAHFKGGKK